MLTLCSEICHSRSQPPSAIMRDVSGENGAEGAEMQGQGFPAAPGQSFKREGTGASADGVGPKSGQEGGRLLRQPRASVGAVDGGGSPMPFPQESSPSQPTGSPADPFISQGRADPFISQGREPGPFGVMRQVSASSMLQSTLKNEVRTRNEELERAQREDEQRSTLVVALEQEVFEKERRWAELKAHIEELGSKGEILEGELPEDSICLHPEGLAAKERERLTREIQAREGEASDLRQRVGALEELIREKRSEVVAKGEATLQLLFQLSSTETQQRINPGSPISPLMQASPTVVVDGEAAIAT